MTTVLIVMIVMSVCNAYAFGFWTSEVLRSRQRHRNQCEMAKQTLKSYMSSVKDHKEVA